MRRLLLTYLLSLLAVICTAQEIRVTSFSLDPRDLEAKLNPVYDAEGVAAALVRVQAATDRLHIEGETAREPSYASGEWLVYLRPSAKSITLKAKDIKGCTYEFGTPLVSYRVYELRLDVPEPQRGDILVLPQMTLHTSQLSYGLMLGYVRHWGGYVSVRSDFRNVPATMEECDGEGYYIDDQVRGWFTGESLSSRFGLCAGAIRRIAGPLCVYAGAGYGQRTLVWKNKNSGDWTRVATSSAQGLQLEGGVLLDVLGHFSLSAGVVHVSPSWTEASVGFGVRF